MSFTKILEVYSAKCLNGPKEDDILEGVNIRPAKILLTIWHNGNKYFLVSMAVLVHLFSVSIYKDYTKMCAFVPCLSFRSALAITLSLVRVLVCGYAKNCVPFTPSHYFETYWCLPSALQFVHVFFCCTRSDNSRVLSSVSWDST